MTVGSADSIRVFRNRFTAAVLLTLLYLTSSMVWGLMRPPKTLTNPQATDEARSLVSFLVNNYGQKVLSGQQELVEIDYIYSVTGKKPAVGVFDLMDYSPSRIEHGANPTGQVESYISWANTGGGIVSLSWHWNAPTDLVDSEEWPWWRGFYTNGTTFDIEAVLADPDGERYQLLIRDLDAIAVELEKFQTAGLPVLWRPLHEASGGWFWWGAHGPGPFIELWQLMYDRYVNVHGLHNLIWVYTVGDADWYPGDAYVDIAGMDIYPDSPDTSMLWEWQQTQSRHEGVKLVALSESGIVPDPDRIRQDDVWWSWFSVWSGDFIHNTDTTFLNTVYHDADIITLDELIDWKNYPVDSSPPSCSLTWPQDNIRMRDNADITINADAADADGSIAKVEFFEGVTKLGEDTAAPFACTWTSVPAGIYRVWARAVDDDGLMTSSSKATLVAGSYYQHQWMCFEAEDAVSDGPHFSTNFPGYSGTGSMLFNSDEGTGIDFTVTAAQAGSYPLIIRYLIPSGSTDKPNRIFVNGVELGAPTFVITNSVWTDFDFGDVTLNAGPNTIRIQHFWGWMYVDYIELQLPSATPCPAGDFDLDCNVDMNDLLIMVSGWLNTYNLTDLANVAGDWLEN